MGIIHYEAFLLSAVLLNLIPGSDTIFILSKATLGDKQQGIMSVLGISSGIFVHTCLAALGLSTILMTSAVAFNLLKWLGALYLMYLGVTSFIKKGSIMEYKEKESGGRWMVYKQGLFTNVLNPKVALFFLSLLPQYVDGTANNGALPFLILGISFVITSTLWSLLLVYTASFFSSWLNKNEKSKKMTNKLAGCIYVALGIHLLRTTAENN